MANNQQPQGGNSMAALLGNMQRPNPGQPQPVAYGGGLQPSSMGGGPQQPNMGGPIGPYQPGGQAPIPPGGAGAPPDAANIQNMLAAMSAQKPQQGAGLGAAGGGPSFGAPGGGGAPGKGTGNPQIKQAIAGLQGGPPMGRPGMGPMRRPQGQGMQPPNPAMRR